MRVVNGIIGFAVTISPFAVIIFPIASAIYAVVGGGYYDTMQVRGKIRVEEDIKSYDERQETRYRLLVSDPKTGYAIEEFLIKDSYPRGIWNSGSLLNTATNQQEKVCTITGKGKRIDFMSWYPHVTNITECSQLQGFILLDKETKKIDG